MKILYHHRTRAQDAQGIHISSLCEAFRGLGHSVQIVAPVTRSRGRLAPKPASSSAPDVCPSLAGVAIPHWFYECLALIYNLPATLMLCIAILRRRPDFIYERYTLFTFAGLITARVFRLPFVLEVNAPLSQELQNHGDLVFRRLAQGIEDWLCRKATHTVVVTQAMADIFVARGVPSHRLVVMPNGVDESRFHTHVDGESMRQRHGIQAGPVIGFVGWIRPWHGVDGLIQACLPLMQRRPEMRLLVVGDGPAVPDLRRLAQELDLTGQVIFTGPVARDEIPAYIAALDIAVQPDVTDYASPMKLFEYLAIGRAVVAPDKPNIREVVEDGRSALLFPPRDWSALSAQLERLVEDVGFRHSLAEEAASLVARQGYTWRGNARKVIDLVASDAGMDGAKAFRGSQE